MNIISLIAAAAVSVVTISPGSDAGKQIADAIAAKAPEDSLTIRLQNARYDFHPEQGLERELYISNHDQPNPRAVGIAIEGASNVTIDGNGADLIFHGRMIPMIITDSRNCSVRNLSIDFENPHIAQIEVVENDTVNGTITYRPAPWVRYEVTADSSFMACGDGWSHVPVAGIAFESENGRVVYRTADIWVGTRKVTELEPGLIRAPWVDKRLSPGTRIALRSWSRPTPGIVIADDRDITLTNVTVHYAEGMALVAQMTENISLQGFQVSIRKNSGRYFTSQADATHFSGCKGVIRSVDGLYEGMMDDAINVHGTYLKLIERRDSVSVLARYMHGQAYGFRWGEPGDTVQFISSATMDLIGEKNVIEEISMEKGGKDVEIRFRNPVPHCDGAVGIENLTWTPEVIFSGNTIRNNRARGALFSTPRRVLVEDNLFDHTSGTAILLCGDCNGWYETGACRDVTIRRNRFVNALTSMYQFTNAVISIYPEIPQLENQNGYFHSGIKIYENVFDSFDLPLLYAKSVNGLEFRDNIILTNSDFAPWHPQRARFRLERVTNTSISD